MKFEYAPGATPIDPDEAAALIPSHITLQRELNEYEEANILAASEWLFARRRGDPLDHDFVHTVHNRMFNETWKWAGKPRRSDKNIGVAWTQVPMRLREVLQDARAQIQYKAYPAIEIAARFHHRLVAVHVFPNGNGRHARLMADLLMTELADQRLGWGHGSLAAASDLRQRYIAALRAADASDYHPLLLFLSTTHATQY